MKAASEEHLLNDKYCLKRKQMFPKKKIEESDMNVLDGLTDDDAQSIYRLEDKLNEVIRYINSERE